MSVRASSLNSIKPSPCSMYARCIQVQLATLQASHSQMKLAVVSLDYFLCFAPGLRVLTVARDVPTVRPAPKPAVGAKPPKPGVDVMPKELLDAVPAAGVPKPPPKLKPAPRHTRYVVTIMRQCNTMRHNAVVLQASTICSRVACTFSICAKQISITTACLYATQCIQVAWHLLSRRQPPVVINHDMTCSTGPASIKLVRPHCRCLGRDACGAACEPAGKACQGPCPPAG